MILADSSAWIDFLRGRSEWVADVVSAAMDGKIATTGPIQLELLAGATNDADVEHLEALLGLAQYVPCEHDDFVRGAEIYRATRRAGRTVRRMSDCVIAAVAIRASIPILHRDRDFDVIAQVSELQIVEP